MPTRILDRDLKRLGDHIESGASIKDFKFTPRKKRDNEESRIQCALIEWWHHAHAGFGVPEHLLFSIPNGGWRDKVGAAILSREGLRPGVSDLFLAVARSHSHGIFIEMKKPTGKVSDNQDLFISNVTAQGYAAYACYNLDEAVGLITRYLTNSEDDDFF